MMGPDLENDITDHARAIALGVDGVEVGAEMVVGDLQTGDSIDDGKNNTENVIITLDITELVNQIRSDGQCIPESWVISVSGRSIGESSDQLNVHDYSPKCQVDAVTSTSESSIGGSRATGGVLPPRRPASDSLKGVER